MKHYDCPECDFSHSQEPKFVAHIVDFHHVVDLAEYYCQHVLRASFPLCECGCGEKLVFKSWRFGFSSKYLRGHNARVSTAFSDPEVVKRSVAKRIKTLAQREKKSWNDGETKATDPRIAKMSLKIQATLQEIYDTKKVIPWQLGETIATNTSVAQAAASRNARLASGEITVWNDGLTKETDARVAGVAEKLRLHYETHPYPLRLTPEEVMSRVVSLAPNLDCLTDVASYKNKYSKFQFRCKTCKYVFERTLMYVFNSYVDCQSCCPKESKGQLELFEFVRSLASDTVLSDRSIIAPKELDVWVPSKMFAIEYNGLYWHSEINVSDTYHENKRELCAEKNVRLLHVFEDEWRDKRPIVESLIRARTGCLNKSIGARLCDIRELSVAHRREFFDETHIDGDVSATVAWGLFFEDKLVAALSLRHPTQKRYNDCLEVARFSLKLNTSVPGGLGKLVAKAKDWAKKASKRSLMTYVDRRLGDAHGYRSVGFADVGTTNKRFWWVENDKTRVHRLKYRADKNNGLSENDVAAAHHVYRIWGCSNLVLALDVNT